MKLLCCQINVHLNYLTFKSLNDEKEKYQKGTFPILGIPYTKVHALPSHGKVVSLEFPFGPEVC